MKKILLPTDFSNNAWNAIVYALEFLKNEECEFHILHTYTPTFYRVDYMMGGPTYSAIPDMGVEIAQAGLDKILVDIKVKFNNPKHKFKIRSAFNTLTNEVMELAETKDFDLIFMGTQGATGAQEIFLGTHTVQVIRKSKIPVIAIPKGYGFKDITSIVFSTDYEQLYKEEALLFLTTLVNTHKAKLTVLHVKEEHELADKQKVNKSALVDSFKEVHPNFVEERGTLIPNAIHDYIKEHKSGLLAMMNRKHSFFERLLVKQNIDTIGFHTTIPFLVMPETSKIKK